MKAKVLRIISRLNIGGPSIHTVLLTSELNKKGYKDILVCGKVSRSEGDMSYFARDKKLEPVVIKELGREISPINDIISFWKLYAIMRRESPLIVHTHAAKAGALGRMAALFAGVPVRIHTFHGHIFDGYFSPLKARIFLFIERFLALFTDRVIVVSESVKNEIVNKLKVISPDRCSVIPLGFDLDMLLKGNIADKAGSLRKELNIYSETILIGIVGRLVPIKNHRMFLEMAKYILGKRRDKKSKFVIMGDGEMAAQLKNYAKELGIDRDVFFKGWVRDIPSIYSDIDIVTLTSLNEGTPVSLIEAMASGRPVVATDVGGVRDLVTDGLNGFLVQSGDVKGLAEKVIGLLDDAGKRKEMGDNGKDTVKARYFKERLVSDITLLYEKCLTEKKVKSRKGFK